MVGSTAMLPALVKSLGHLDVFARFALAAPMVVGIAVAIVGGILLTVLGSVIQGQMSEEEKTAQVEEVVVAKDAKDLQRAMQDTVTSIDVKALSGKLDALSKATGATFREADAIFNKFDEDGNGVLQDQEVTKCIDALQEHVLQKIKENGLEMIGRSDSEAVASFEKQLKALNPKKIREAIINVVDPDHDGKITKAEAREGFKKVSEWFEKA